MWAVFESLDICSINLIHPYWLHSNELRLTACEYFRSERDGFLLLLGIHVRSLARNVHLLHSAQLLLLLHGDGEELHTNAHPDYVLTVTCSLVLYICFSIESRISWDNNSF